MNVISSQVLNRSPKYSFQKQEVSSLKLRPSLNSDVFQRTVNFKGIEASNFSSEEEILNAYNKTYAQAVKHHPVISELNIKKPEITFCDKEEGYLLAYNFMNNSILASPFVKEPFVLIALYDDQGKIEEPVSVIPKSKTSELNEYFEKNKNLKSVLLTNEEKDAFLQASFAHELRHWVQTHLVASNEASSSRYLGEIKHVSRALQAMLADLANFVAKTGEDPEKEVKEIFTLEYSVNYKPKKLLDKDMKIKMSLHPKDTRYFSVNKHYAKGLLNNGVKTGSEKYMALPHEADAFNYQFEFFNEIMQKGDKKGRRPEIMGAMLQITYRDANIGLMKMSEYGYEPVFFE